jgi:hypothetical protein
MEVLSIRTAEKGNSVRKIKANPVEHWLSSYVESSRSKKKQSLDRFMRWLHQQPGWQEVDYVGLLVCHVESEDQYELLDLIQAYVNQHAGKWAHSTMRDEYSRIRNYFEKNRCPLPQDTQFKIKSMIPPIKGNLESTHVRLMALAARPVYRSMILFKWQSMSDTARLIMMNHPPYSDEIVHKMREWQQNGKQGIIQIEVMSGRKKLLNDPRGIYRLAVGKDALDALIDYFENHREGGWPKPGEALWLYPESIVDEPRDWQQKQYAGIHAGKPVTAIGLIQTWRRLLRRTGIVKGMGKDRSTRFGFNLHEMRDAATTLLHKKALKHGLDLNCVKFWCGQNGQLDKNDYDKFYRDSDYTAEQYMIAEPFLNIISNQNPEAILDAEKRTAKQYQAQNKEFSERLDKQGELIEQLTRAIKQLQQANAKKI